MLSRIRRKNNINSQSAFSTQSAVCILSLVCILYPVCSLQYAFCTDQIGIAGYVRASLKSGPKYRSSKKKFSETVCWRAPEDKHNDRTMITLYQLRTNADAWLTNIAAPDALVRDHSMCLREPTTQVWTFRLLDSNCILRSSEMWFKVVIFIKPYKHFISSHLSFWGGGGSMRDYFRSRSTMQLPSTEYNFRPR